MNGVQTIFRSDPTSVIRAIWNSNRDEVTGRLAVLEDAVVAMIEGQLSPEDRVAAEAGAHKLAGAVGTFGFGLASEAARKLEGILAGTCPISLDQTLVAADEVVALRGDLNRDPSPAAEPAADRSLTPAPADPASRSAGGATRQSLPAGPLVAIAVTGRRRRKQLTAAATDRGFQSLVIGAHGWLPPEGQRPDAALIDLGGGEGSLALIAGLAALDPPVPSLALTPPSNAPCDRVSAARAGARGFLSAEASPEELFSAVQGLLTPPNALERTVLVIDHVPASLSSVRAALQNAGLGVTGLADPAQFWEALEETQPDLVILESGLPGVGGAELCRVLRSDANWAALPVLLVSAYDDAATVAALFDAGADDFMVRPFVGTDLAGRVRNRLKRARVLRTNVLTDRNEDAHALDRAAMSTAGTVAADYDVDVVVVEDDPLLAELLRHALTTRGYRFRLFIDGQAAAGELAGSPPTLRSRVILLDVDLPALNGFDVLRQMAITDNLAATRVIMLTAHSSETEIVNAMELGAFDHVAKPFSVPVLMQRVRRALGN